jgi:homoserine kinase type II
MHAYEDKKFALQPSIRDIHRDHVLFSGDSVSGLVDFGAMRIDLPLVDIARMVGSFAGDHPDQRSMALEAYSEFRPLSDGDLRLIDILDDSGTVLAGLNWLTWLYVDCRDMGPVEPIIRRLDEILRRLERMA